MKRFLLAMAVVCGFATVANGQTSYGIKAGVTFPKVVTSGEGLTITSDANTGFYLTGYADVGLSNGFTFQPGISLQNKGGKYQIGSENVKMNLMYIEVPLNFVYYIPAGMGNLFFGAGPYVAYGVSAKVSYGNLSESGSFDEADIKAFDAGVNILGGYRLGNGLSLNAGYGWGLTNIDKDSGATTKNKLFSVGIGFQF